MRWERPDILSVFNSRQEQGQDSDAHQHERKLARSYAVILL